MLEELNTELNPFQKIIICDKMWIFQFDPDMKLNLLHWKTLSSQE